MSIFQVLCKVFELIGGVQLTQTDKHFDLINYNKNDEKTWIFTATLNTERVHPRSSAPHWPRLDTHLPVGSLDAGISGAASKSRGLGSSNYLFQLIKKKKNK